MTSDADPDLDNLKAELQKPVVLEDSDLATFELDRSVNCFRGEMEWDSREIDINLSPDASGSPAVALAAAKMLWRERHEWDRRIKDLAVKELLAVKNEIYLQDDETEMTSEEFKARMKIRAISVQSNGGFGFWCDNEELFWDHPIFLEGNIQEGLTGVSLGS